MSNNLVKLWSTFFYVGYFPKAPGSLASLCGLLIYFWGRSNILLCLLFFVMITAIGFLVSGRMEGIVREKDPSCVVIDEVSGVMIAFFMLPMNWAVVITTFLLFRAFDMFKIYPVNKFESMPGGIGIMMDDIIAGIYTNLTMQMAIRLAGMNA